jgi:hypothetical protein
MFRRRDRRNESEVSVDAVDAEIDEGAEGLEEASSGDETLEDQPEDMTADLESQAADYLADNDVWMYGPNAEAVLEILDRLEELVPDEARPIAEAWLAIPKSDRDRARKAARKMAEEDEEVGRHLELAREAVGTWMAVTGPYPEFVAADPDWGRLCAQSGEAALDAATAVILEGKLDEKHYEALLEPWSEAMAALDDASADDASADDAAEVARIEGTDDEPTGDTAADESEDDEEEVAGEGEFGPNSLEVGDFMNRLWLLTPEQVGRLVSGWQNTERDDLKAAHERLRVLVDEDPEWRDQVRRAQDKLAPWLNAGRVQETSGFLGQTGGGESRKMAGPALADAVAALVLGDLLDRSDAELLYGAWFNLIGAPQLPASDDDDAEAAEEEVVSGKAEKPKKKPAAEPAAADRPKPGSVKAAPAPAAKTAPAKPSPAKPAAGKSAKASAPKGKAAKK